MPASFVYVTVSSREEANQIGRALVTERLVACVNIFDGMQSLYWWNDRVESADEVVLLGKTRPERVDAVTERIKALHSYECPCVVTWQVDAGNPDYMAWIHQETSQPGETV